jgi:DNA-binding HxlR family transcriptional regulator
MAIEQRWPHVEQPILNALASGDGGDMTGEELEAATGIEHVVLMRALRDLKEAGYIEARLTMSDPDYPIRVWGIRLLEMGLRHTGVWPASDDFGEGLLAALQQLLDKEPDEEERTKLQGAVTALKALGMVALTSAVSQAVGIGIGHI